MVMMFDADETMLLITSFGFQPSLLAITYAWIANLATANTAKVSAPELFSFATCDWTSTEVDSYGSAATILTFDRWMPSLEAAEQVLAVVVVLEEHRDLRARSRACEVLPVDPAFRLVAGLEPDRVRVLRSVATECRRARGGKELRHLVGVEVVADGEVVLGSDRVEDREDLVLLRRAAGRVAPSSPCRMVVEIRERDLAAEHAPVAR